MSIIYKRERWRDYVCEVPLDIQKYTWPSSRNRKRTEQIAFLGESSAERLDFNLTLKLRFDRTHAWRAWLRLKSDRWRPFSFG